jgi:hypothetical protein
MSRSYTSSPPSASMACSGTALPLLLSSSSQHVTVHLSMSQGQTLSLRLVTYSIWACVSLDRPSLLVAHAECLRGSLCLPDCFENIVIRLQLHLSPSASSSTLFIDLCILIFVLTIVHLSLLVNNSTNNNLYIFVTY